MASRHKRSLRPGINSSNSTTSHSGLPASTSDNQKTSSLYYRPPPGVPSGPSALSASPRAFTATPQLQLDPSQTRYLLTRSEPSISSSEYGYDSGDDVNAESFTDFSGFLNSDSSGSSDDILVPSKRRRAMPHPSSSSHHPSDGQRHPADHGPSMLNQPLSDKLIDEDFTPWEEERTLAFWRLECHVDNDETGKIEAVLGSTQKLVERYRGGEDVSVRLGQCLVRGGSEPRKGTQGYDRQTITFLCVDCGGTHNYKTLRAVWEAALIAATREEQEQEQQQQQARQGESRKYEFLALLERVFHGLHGSHTCGNTHCSDPFHVPLERGSKNRSRTCLLASFRLQRKQ
ncbi:hypothetical protein LTR70_008695 [Exophiala xenobiotica]|uniref:Zinc-binding loop region of homing endonuclease domain-containing protein n=1 Tax=Lithohypha guttulata TaxID=1690604 RepID=A0ABR0K3I9_9EURO|nr:hypothetical protein LTR24_007215 [Lithohypha guttulata]KAK5311598.1 hypothetical protein LTR70_008695 [Exophiala xenobiotica]